MDGYMKIKTVGKGSFGTATLYKRLEDNLMVVMKDVFLTDMSQTERRLALNEVQVLSALNHPNIIRYLGSFERNGSLVIIMDYADGGNLAQLISQTRERKETFAEAAILNIFSQICSGINYMHMHKILHRDLKAANIFLNKNGNIKIGDFGISKMMDTRSQAQTIVGTPYYLSPEMCEGKDYNEKSDIWAMGCILYELAALRKPFEAPSLPLLVQKITTCEFSTIPDKYSDGLFELIELILQIDPQRRPSADYIQTSIIPVIEQSLASEDFGRRFSSNSIFSKSIPKERSVLYELHGFTSNAKLIPVELPHVKIMDFSNSRTHFMVVTIDRKVYTWGEDMYGQLAHGTPDAIRKQPMLVDCLRSKDIVRCFAGDGYSLFLNKNGHLFSCGDGKFGCLGHGNWNDVTRPTIIESLLNINISEVSCGSKHVVVLATNGKVFSWGSAEDGQLELGHSQYCCKPMVIRLSNEYNLQKVYAGPNSSALLTTAGKVLFSGNNKYNKLGFKNIPFLKKFVLLEIDERIKEISMGSEHTILATESGSVLCFGCNNEGQCGDGKIVKNTRYIKVDINKVTKVSAGPTFSVAATEDNVIYFWGTSYNTVQINGQNSREGSKIKLINSQEVEIGNKTSKLKYSVPLNRETHISILEPKPKSILVLFASIEKIQQGKILWLAALNANENSVSVMVHTTVFPPVKQQDDCDDHSKVLVNELSGVKKASNNEISLPNTPHEVKYSF